MQELYPISEEITRFVTAVFTRADITGVEKVQTLWSGYGDILRVQLSACDYPSVILKHICLPQPSAHTPAHPRGWGSELSHRRKLRSYRIETYWYQHYAEKCTPGCAVPKCLAVENSEHAIYLLLSDLNQQGFPQVKKQISLHEVALCLQWLANFHGVFLQHSSKGLWECGTYWHLDTRPDELAALQNQPLKQAAPYMDAALKCARYQTLVHGDAKLANFCFASSAPNQPSTKVAAVDFQYVGRGCGTKDVAYFLGSCLSDSECEQHQAALLKGYFEALSAAVKYHHPDIDPQDLEREWRALFDVAWADFHRFLAGWSPEHWKLTPYSEKLTRQVVQRLLPK